MSPITRKPTNIQLSLLRVNPLSDVPILDVSVIANANFACVRRNAPFPPASDVAVSSNAVGVRYAVLGSPSRN